VIEQQLIARPATVAAQVREFHAAFGLIVRDTPQTSIPRDERDFRVGLLLEETGELVAALLGLAEPKTLARTLAGVVVAHEQTYGHHPAAPEVVDVARECADVLAMVYGTALHYGIDLDAVTAEVMAAGMRKLDADGRPIKRGDGKVLKPQGWTPPDVAGAIGMPAPDVERAL
jgi:predicted HAD superfamily Cof-like phosphohydrolase